MQQDRVQVGVSSACFFPTETIHAVQKLAAWNIPNIEVFFNSPRELKEDYVQKPVSYTHLHRNLQKIPSLRKD